MFTSMKTLITSGLFGRSTDLGLLVLRVGIGASLFLRHGWEKIVGFGHMAAHFPDPIGIVYGECSTQLIDS